MKRRLLGRTGFEISLLGFGAWQIGGPGGEFAWQPQDEALSIAAIHAALDAGVNWIDTAPAYGLGRSEEVVGRALVERDERPLVFTKCGAVWDEAGRQWFDLSPVSLRRELEASLRRLRVDAIDLYQVHWPVPDEQLETGWEVLAEFKREGLVRAIGASNFTIGQLERLKQIAPVETLQPPYSLLDRRVETDLLPYCRGEGIRVLVYSPLQSGLLGGTMTKERMESLPDDDWRRRDPQFQEPHLAEYLAFVDCLRDVASCLGVTVPQLAVAWVLRDPVVTGAIVGISRADQVEEITHAASLELDRELTKVEECLARTLTLPRPPARFVPVERPSELV